MQPWQFKVWTKTSSASSAPKGLKLHKKNNSAEEGRELPDTYKDGRYLINLDRSLETYWLVLK